MRNKNEAFVSYSDGLALASRLKLPTKQLRDAMNENVNQISIELSKDEADPTNKEAYLIVHIWPSRSLINATNLLAVRRCRRTFLPSLLNRGGIHDIHYRAYGMQGTYISYADGLRLCNALEFSEARLDQIKHAIRESWLGPIIHMQHEPKINFEEVRLKMAAEKMINEKMNVRTHVQIEEFLLSDAKFPSFACSTSGVKTKLSNNGVDNDVNDQYFEELDFEDEEIGFYKYAESFTRASQAYLNNNANIASNQVEPQQSREYDRQRAAENSSRENDEIANESCDNEFDHDGSERNRANIHNKMTKKTRKQFSKVHRATLETAYCHNPRLHRTARAGIAEELGLEEYRVHVCSFIEAFSPHANNCYLVEMVRKSTPQSSYSEYVRIILYQISRKNKMLREEAHKLSKAPCFLGNASLSLLS